MPSTLPHREERPPLAILTGQRALGFLLRWAPLALIVAAGLGVLAYQRARHTPPTYEASIALDIGRSNRTPAGIDVATPPNVTPYAYRSALWEGGIVVSGFETTFGATIDANQRERLERTVRVAIEEHDVSSILRVTVRHGEADTAANVANAIGTNLIAWDAARARASLDRTRDALAATLDDLDAQLRSLPTDAATREPLRVQRDALQQDLVTSSTLATVPAIDWLAPATPAELPVAPRPFFATFVALTLGLIGTYLTAYLATLLDRRVGNAVATEALTGLPVLAHVTRHGTITTQREESSMLAARVRGLTRHERCTTLLVTTPRHAHSGARVAATLAEGATRQGANVLLLDAMSPTQRGPGDTHPATYTHLPVPWHDTPLPALRDALAKHACSDENGHDLILIAAPPLLTNADALAITDVATGVLLASEPSRTRRADLLRSLELLTEQQANTLGIVLTRRGRWRPFTPRAVRRNPRRTAVA